MVMTRRDFDSWIPYGSQLRDLAAAIAAIDAHVNPTFLSNPISKSLPDNFIANAELGGAWHAPSAYTNKSLSIWKNNYNPPLTPAGQQGFYVGQSNKLPRRGLALVFDPFVDAFLAAHLLFSGSIPSGCTVIVLSDYGPLSLTAQLTHYPDWGLEETSLILKQGGTKLGLTEINLFNCLFGLSWRQGAPEFIANAIRERRVLLWNFFPMFRGGNQSIGPDGLPCTCNWLQLCWDFLCLFVAAVGASKVVLACSNEIFSKPWPLNGNRRRPGNRPAHRARINLPPDPLSRQQLQPPAGAKGFAAPPFIHQLSPLPTCVQDLYRIYHPRAWSKPESRDCPTLVDILRP